MMYNPLRWRGSVSEANGGEVHKSDCHAVLPYIRTYGYLGTMVKQLIITIF